MQSTICRDAAWHHAKVVLIESNTKFAKKRIANFAPNGHYAA